MKALLLTDFYMTKKYLKISIGMAILFIVVSVFESNTFFMLFPMVFVGAIPMSLIAYGESFRWNSYLETMPIGRAKFVSSKYLFSLIIFAVFSLLIFASSLISRETEVLLTLLPVIFAVGMLFPAVTLFFMLKLGAEKGRLAYYVAIGVFCGLLVLISSGGDGISVPTVFSGGFALPVILGTVLVFGVSWISSVKAYEKREL